MDRSDEILAALGRLDAAVGRLDERVASLEVATANGFQFVNARLDAVEVRLSRLEARTGLLCQKLLSPAEQHDAGVLPAAFAR